MDSNHLARVLEALPAPCLLLPWSRVGELNPSHAIDSGAATPVASRGIRVLGVDGLAFREGHVAVPLLPYPFDERAPDAGCRPALGGSLVATGTQDETTVALTRFRG